jgi:hypothetical protein
MGETECQLAYTASERSKGKAWHDSELGMVKKNSPCTAARDQRNGWASSSVYSRYSQESPNQFKRKTSKQAKKTDFIIFIRKYRKETGKCLDPWLTHTPYAA